MRTQIEIKSDVIYYKLLRSIVCTCAKYQFLAWHLTDWHLTELVEEAAGGGFGGGAGHDEDAGAADGVE